MTTISNLKDAIVNKCNNLISSHNSDSNSHSSLFNGKINVSDIVDDLTTPDATKPLSAKQGKVISDTLVVATQNSNGLMSSTDKTKLDNLSPSYDIDKVYPVGSIYMSVNNTNPSTLFGGTWEQLQDQFLLGAGSNHSAGSSGGSEDAVVVSHSHTTSVSGASFMSTDGNLGTVSSGKNLAGLSAGSQYPVYATTHANINESSNTASTGESGIGKNMPPYLVVYMWKRIR